MRPHPRTLLRPIVTAGAVLALLAAGCGSDPADPTPLEPVATVATEPTPLAESAAPRPAAPVVEPESQRETAAPRPAASEPEPENLAEPQPENLTEPQPEDLTEPQPENLTEPQPENLAEPETAPVAEPEPEAAPAVEPESRPESGDLAEPGSQLAPCPEGEHRHDGEPCHYDDPEPELVQAEPQPEIAVVEVEDEPGSDEVHPHTTDTTPDPPPDSGVFPSARGDQPTIAWQVHVSGTVEGARPLPAFTPAVQEWSDWCFFDWATRSSDPQAARQQCAIQLSLIGMATELLGVTDQCATRQYRGQLEMLTGEGEFDFATDFGRVGWHACASVIDPDPSDDIASPYFDAGLYEASLMPDDECMRASWAAEVYLHQQGVWMAEWRC